MVRIHSIKLMLHCVADHAFPNLEGWRILDHGGGHMRRVIAFVLFFFLAGAGSTSARVALYGGAASLGAQSAFAVGARVGISHGFSLQLGYENAPFRHDEMPSMPGYDTWFVNNTIKIGFAYSPPRLSWLSFAVLSEASPVDVEYQKTPQHRQLDGSGYEVRVTETFAGHLLGYVRGTIDNFPKTDLTSPTKRVSWDAGIGVRF